MDKVINIVNLIGWSYLLTKVGFSVLTDHQSYANSDISLDLNFLRAIQLFQILDILLIIIGKSKGSILGSFFQILGRNIVTLIFMQSESHKLKFAIVLIIWSIAEVNRYLYYIFKTNFITGLLRYNLFLVLYPIGVYGQMTVINDFIERHQEQITDIYLYCIRFVQVGIVVGMVIIYKYMLKSRKHFMKSIKGQIKTDKQNVQTNSPYKYKSPKKDVKRD